MTYIAAQLRIDAILDAGRRLAEATATVQELEDARPLIKRDAIHRLQQSGVASSATAAEKVVESDPAYFAHRQDQSKAERERLMAWASYEAAKLSAKLAVDEAVAA